MTGALLFDLDGTMMDSDPIHAAVFVDLFARHGKRIDAGFYTDAIHGRQNADIFRDHFPDADPVALADAKEAEFRARLGDSAAPLPGLVALLDRARTAGWPVAVVTNAPRPNADAMLSAIGLRDRIDTLVIGEECARGKPAPDPYLVALAATGADAARSVAFEDSPSGLRAARDAGLLVIGVATSLGARDLRAAGAHATIADFSDPALSPHLARLTGARP